MRSLKVGLFTAGIWALTAASAPAAWDNVFQPTLFERLFNRTPTTTNNYYVAPAVAYASPVVAMSVPIVPVAAPVTVAPACSTCQANSPPPAPACSTCQSPPPAPACNSCNTAYSQRCYYQPVTSYQSQSYYEPVTSYRTSYYYAPVTSYRYSAYYDPSSCGYQQVACPVTSYELRAQSSPVQSWVQRCAQVPVTTYQKSCYWQPQTTCTTTTQGAPIAMDGSPLAPPQAPVAQQQYQAPQQYPAPSIQNVTPPPAVNEQHAPTGGAAAPYDRYYPPQQTQTPPTSFRPLLGAPEPVNAPQSAPLPPVRLNQIAVTPDSNVLGQVVRNDNTPRPGAKVMFVNGSVRETAVANSAGRFQVGLTPGNWLVYLQNSDGSPMYYTSLSVGGTQTASLTMIQRN